MALLTDGALFQSVVTNVSDQKRMLARVELAPGARKLIKFYDMSQILVALRFERDHIIEMESEVPTELVSDFQVLDYQLNLTTRTLRLEIHRGDASIDGTVVRVSGMHFTIPNVSTHKTYYIYVGQNNTLFYEEDSSPDQAAILLWKLEVKDPIQDIRFVDLRAFFTRDDRYDQVTDVFSNQVSLIRGMPNGVAALDAQGLVPLSQLPSSLKEMVVVADLAARDALTPYEFLRVHVLDATADPTVETGWAEYLWYQSGWHKVSERDSLDVNITWANIQNKPTASVTELDDAVNKRHTHLNLNVLENLSDTNEELYYNGIKVTGGVEQTLTTWAQIGVEKKTMVFVLPRTLAAGAQPVELEFPFPGVMHSVTASCIVPAFFNNTTFIVEKCAHADYTTTPVWTSVLQSPMTILENKKTESAEALFTESLVVHPRDHFRVSLVSVGYGIEGMTVQVTVQLFSHEE